MYIELPWILDETYISVKVDVANIIRYRSCKGDIATNVLGIYTRNMKFVHVLPGWKGSATDSKVLRHTISKPNGLTVPQGKCMVFINHFFFVITK